MRKDFAFLAGTSNNGIIMLVCLAVMVSAAGCAATPKQTVPYPVYSDSACEAAVRTGTQAIAGFSRENVLAQMDDRSPDYAKERDSLAGALSTLKPGKVNPARPEYERIAVCFETALEGMDRIIIGRKEGNSLVEALGWKIYDQSTSELLLVLEPHAGSANGRARVQ